mgnify:CR=1 FL=1
MQHSFHRVQTLLLDGVPVPQINFRFDGPVGDKHYGRIRKLDGHDGRIIRNTKLRKGHPVLNTRPWTVVSFEELRKIEKKLGVQIPSSCLPKSIVVRGISNFSRLPPGTKLVFPQKVGGQQVILVILEQNTPCRAVGDKLQSHYPEQKDLSSRFTEAAINRMGFMGSVLSEGFMKVNGIVEAHPP